MPNPFDLIVSYQDKQHPFHIGSDIKLLDTIMCLIGEYFQIDINNFIVEIYDPRYKLFFILDDYCLTDLQSNSKITENNPVKARVRSRYQSAFNIASDTTSLSTSLLDDVNVKPDHVIIWLDAHIGQPNEYGTFKRRYNKMIAFDETASTSSDIDNGIDDFTSDDIDNLIGAISNRTLIFSHVQGPILYSFSDIQSCLEFINATSTSQKTIFLISSGYLGRILIPQIFDNMYVHSIYILTSNIEEQFSWAMDYYDKILIFEHDSDLFSRLTRDIASYYVQKCLVDYRSSRLNLFFLKWARNLYKIADENDRRAIPYFELKTTEERLKKLELSLENEPGCEEGFQSDEEK